MNKNLILLVLLCLSINSYAQKNIKIYGRIFDANTFEPISYCNVANRSSGVGTVTDLYGNYTLMVKAGTIQIQASFVGYKKKLLKSINIKTDTLIYIYLEPGLELQEYVVYSGNNGVTNNERVGLLQLSSRDIAFAPSAAGESNLIASLKTLPGVSAGKEGGTELSVRGGRFDQNLILLDDVPVYNINHSFGLLSLFNSATIKNVNLYKGAIPSNYGGRLSSVVDIATKEGNNQHMGGSINFSTVAGSFALEGPLVKNKTSYMLSFRRSMPDLLVRAGHKIADSEILPILYFMDVNAKVNHTFNDNNQIFFSYYTGQDKLGLLSTGEENYAESNQGWGNHLFSIRWNSRLKNKMNLHVASYYSRFFEFYEQKTKEDNITQKQTANSHMDELGAKCSFSHVLSHALNYKAGIEMYYRSFHLPEATYFNDGSQNIYSHAIEQQTGAAVFATAQYTVDHFAIRFGLRSDVFAAQDETKIFAQPRLQLKYYHNTRLTFKAGMMRNIQTLMALRKANNGFPGYTYIPLTKRLKPLDAWQVSGGVHYKAHQHLYFDVEFYYKEMNNVAFNHLNSTQVFPINQWDEHLRQGRSDAYGMDFTAELIKKNYNIRLSYSNAKSTATVYNNGTRMVYPTDYDIRHDVNLCGEIKLRQTELKKKWLTYNQAFHSGVPFTLPGNIIKNEAPLFNQYKTFWETNNNYIFDTPNNHKLEPYHRLDIAYHSEKKKRRGSRILTLGLINVYGHLNTYIIYQDGGDYKKLTLFPPMPIISYKRTF